ncbi:DUF1993 domain-containing protein [Sphingobium phenoxybenzoativorans]|uniref:DUF1993 domain-containing protein n=1 Tax=Sphingobium phenoxybenzoativorans TaxID=1592790 RepID=A0A975Q0U6_9SPHN|nr:DUF1993 domain-containing protein [Sphingobium phenoxybenzoativorans]QUT05124.1 DUF1993 domain-containing protein [Sphingobium phenoxybenzoativorans]
MPFSFYAAIVPPFQKMLNNLNGLLCKAEAYCDTENLPPEDLIYAKLAPDMLPFAYQIKSAVVHSSGAIAAVCKGVFSPDMTEPPGTFAGLRQRIEDGQAILAAIIADDFDMLPGQPMRFQIKTYRADFTADTFLLSFSVPNFYFHATTAYDILRAKGLTIGKVDYIGQLPLRKMTI